MYPKPQHNVNTIELLDSFLENIGKALDITPAQYQTVIDRYTAVATHLAKDGSALKPYDPEIKPQGSFLLGTMIRPIIEDDELDVDLVCRLKNKKAEWTQSHVKHVVGDQIKADQTYNDMLDEEGNRCWTLKYHEAAKFHMDILPAIIEEGQMVLLEKAFSNLDETQIRSLDISITDKRLTNYTTETNTRGWLKSNPWGYAAWFKDRASLELQKAFSIREAVEPLPEYNEDKDPLLRVVQILKRHRDIMFGGDEHKPISIIITTLAAKAYNKETNLIVAINSVLNQMEQFIQPRYIPELGKEIKWISNPVNDRENFADKWVGEPEKEKRFYDWLQKARSDFKYLSTVDMTTAYRYLKETIGTRAVNDAIREIGMADVINEQYQPLNYNRELLTVTHREHPGWRLNLTNKVEVHGRYTDSQGNSHTITPRTIVPKECNIYFVAETDVPKPFDVYWQVVNTGEEAKQKHGLRGGIFHSKTAGKGGLNQRERSSYTGLHWVECFIVKSGICVARSYEFFVNIE